MPLNDIEAAKQRLLSQYNEPAEAAGKALKNAMEMPPRSRGREFWTEVLEAFQAAGVKTLVFPNDEVTDG